MVFGGRGVLQYVSYTDMCHRIGYGFGGWGTSVCKLYRYVPRGRDGFWEFFSCSAGYSDSWIGFL